MKTIKLVKILWFYEIIYCFLEQNMHGYVEKNSFVE